MLRCGEDLRGLLADKDCPEEYRSINRPTWEAEFAVQTTEGIRR